MTRVAAGPEYAGQLPGTLTAPAHQNTIGVLRSSIRGWRPRIRFHHRISEHPCWSNIGHLLRLLLGGRKWMSFGSVPANDMLYSPVRDNSVDVWSARNRDRRARIDCNSRLCLPLTARKTDLSSLQATAINDVKEINSCGPCPHELISLTSVLRITSEETLEPNSYTRLPNTSWLLNTGNEYFRNAPAMRTAHRIV